MTMRLLASTTAPTHNSKRSLPSARQRFMPRPRASTEMRPSMPARKRWPFLNAALFSNASRSGAFLPPRCGMHTVLTPLRAHDATFFAEEAAIGAIQLWGADYDTAVRQHRFDLLLNDGVLVALIETV